MGTSMHGGMGGPQPCSVQTPQPFPMGYMPQGFIPTPMADRMPDLGHLQSLCCAPNATLDGKVEVDLLATLCDKGTGPIGLVLDKSQSLLRFINEQLKMQRVQC